MTPTGSKKSPGPGDANAPQPAQRDRLFSVDQPHLVDFAFSKEVVAVFPDMIRRSVPGYETVLPIAALLATQHLPAGGLLYDLGCSQGASTAAVLHLLGNQHSRIVAIDNAKDMLDSATSLITDPRVEFLCKNVEDVEFEPCNVVLLNYILQFLQPDQRLHLLMRLRSALAPDGCVILSEKIHLDDTDTDRWFNEVHLAFKRANGYSEMEVARKRSALENVMIIDSEAQHRQRLQEAGFSRINKWFQCLNWASFIIQP
ncbi:MAG: carboxy-S-adenosyl-L-methionine synthase CmoA [Pseudomonadales bacterium]